MADVESINVPSQSKTIRSKRCCGIRIGALESVEEIGTLGRQRRIERDGFSALRMRQLQAMRVQEHPRQSRRSIRT